MSDTVYKDLITSLGMRGRAAPTLECPEMYALLEELFTPEEAGLAGQMPMGAVSTADIASSTGRDVAEVERLIDSMCNKGLVIGRPRGGVEVYSLLQILPGIFEYQFMKGEVNDRTRKLARLFEDYQNLVYDLADQAVKQGTKIEAFPFARVVAVEEEISAGTAIQPYDKVSSYIDDAEHIAVSQCYCRHHGELLPRGSVFMHVPLRNQRIKGWKCNAIKCLPFLVSCSCKGACCCPGKNIIHFFCSADNNNIMHSGFDSSVSCAQRLAS